MEKSTKVKSITKVPKQDTKQNILVQAAKPFYVEEGYIETCDRKPEPERPYVDIDLDREEKPKKRPPKAPMTTHIAELKLDELLPVDTDDSKKYEGLDEESADTSIKLDCSLETDEIIIDDLLLDIDFQIE